MTVSDYIEKWGSLKPSLKENASLLLGVVGLFGWLGITPEIAGQGLYTLVRFAVPVIEFPLGAFFMYSMLTRKHIVEKRDLEALISKTEGKVQLLSEEVNRMTKKNESLASEWMKWRKRRSGLISVVFQKKRRQWFAARMGQVSRSRHQARAYSHTLTSPSISFRRGTSWTRYL